MKKQIFIALFLTATALLFFYGCEDENEGGNNEENKEPTCSITSPASGISIPQDTTITISAKADDEDGNLKEVRFYLDGTEIGSAGSSPYNYEWSPENDSTGTHTVKAEAIDEENATAEDEVQITLESGGDQNIDMVTVSGGKFDMGCTSEQNNCGNDETPVHTVTVDSFKISKYEITNQQYAHFMNEIGASSDGSYNGTEYLDIDEGDCNINYSGSEFVSVSGKENHPVIEVTWYGAKAFCEQYDGRLPTEAEWEFAARGGNSANATLYAGSDNIDEVAWYSDNYGTKEVGTKSPNELGIYDMSGNVWEWCNDWYSSDYYSNSPQDNPQGPSSGSYRVLRGGSWVDYVFCCRVAFRYSDDPGVASRIDSGFRFCQDL
jgi:formylglycine-generating enzyme required for sulfatase activity